MSTPPIRTFQKDDIHRMCIWSPPLPPAAPDPSKRPVYTVRIISVFSPDRAMVEVLGINPNSPVALEEAIYGHSSGQTYNARPEEICIL
jgi:hypothetical protein